MRRAFADIALGLRLAATGGSDSRLRAALTALGVAFGVALLLFAASVPNMVSAHNARLNARTPEFSAGATSLLEHRADTTFHGNNVTVSLLQRTGPRPPLPPGINRIPDPGQMLVSPALERLLQSPAGAELARRLRARVVGTIAQSGLSGPAELFAYRGGTKLRLRGGIPIGSFGTHAGPSGRSPLIILLVILMVVALLLPVGVFVATASRFGSEQRNQRLAALRLLGLDRAGTARVAAGESLLGALAGVALGVVGFLAVLRPLVPLTDIAGISVFAQDVRPSLALAALALILVPVAAVAFALLAMRHVAIEPLGVSRRGRPPRRRLAWRLCTPALGFLLLALLIGNAGRLASTAGEVEASAGVVLVLIGVCALLPWLVETAVVRANGGSVSWLLAVRRLRMDHGTSGRIVGAIGLAVAGAIALQAVFSGAERVNTPGSDPMRGVVAVQNMVVPAGFTLSSVERQLRSVAGVGDLFVVGVGPQEVPVTIAPCSTITELTGVEGCRAGSSYLLSQFSIGERPGQLIRVAGRSLRIPADARPATLRPQFAVGSAYMGVGSLLVAPRAAARLGLRIRTISASARVSAAHPAAEDRLLDAVAKIDPMAQATELGAIVSPRDLTLEKLRRILTAGGVAVLLVIGASLLVSVAEQLRERRRVLAVMSAFGTRRSTLAYSVLWQTALPVLLGLTLAIVLGAALGAVLMEIAHLPVGFDLGSIALLAGAGLAVVAGVTALTLPILHRQISPEALRAE